jgi:hypothetical protein
MKPTDAPAALVMGIGMLGFGLTMILRPGNAQSVIRPIGGQLEAK